MSSYIITGLGNIINMQGRICIVADLGKVDGGGHTVGLIELKTGNLFSNVCWFHPPGASYNMLLSALIRKYNLQPDPDTIKRITKLSDSLEQLIKDGKNNKKESNRYFQTEDAIIAEFLVNLDTLVGAMYYGWEMHPGNPATIVIETHNERIVSMISDNNMSNHTSYTIEGNIRLSISMERLFELYGRESSRQAKRYYT